MAGHSHWSKVKWKKGLSDIKKGKIFSKFAQQITIAAREGGSDPNSNPNLKMIIEKAKEFNLPKENIERAIKRGRGELSGAKLEEVIFEAYGPGGIALIIEGITDNRNRSLGEIKQILNQNGGKLVPEGSVRWMFEKKGVITINFSLIASSQLIKKEDLEIMIIEEGAEDFSWQGEILEIYTKPEELEKIKKRLEKKGIRPQTVSLEWSAKEKVKISERDQEACRKLFEALDENEAVQEIYSNLQTSL